MFAARYQAKYASKYPRRRRPGPRRWLAVFLLCTLVLFSTLDPSTTFSRYMVNLQDMFLLNTSHFYLTPSLNDNQLTYDWDLNFTENTVLAVANSSGSNVTTHDMHYSITLSEVGPNPLFDLYLDDGLGVKTRCENNVINGTLTGGSALSDSYTLCFGLKDEAVPPEQEVTELNLVVASSEPYIRSYTFKVYITAEEPDMIEIPGTEIERPNVEIPEGEIMVFKEEEFQYLTVEDLLNPLVVDVIVDDLGRPDLIGGSLYVPASAGDLLVDDWDEHIEWDVAGHVILEPNILVDSYKPVNIVSHYGDVILNNTTIAGDTQPYQVNITAEEGNIEANGATIVSRSSESGVISLVAQLDINVGTAEITSAGDDGVNIQSEAGNIEASNAEIVSTNGATTAAVVIQTPGFINLDGATVESKGSAPPPAPALLINSTGDSISAKNANVTCTNGGTYLEITAREFVDLEQSSIISNGTYGLILSCIEGGINAPHTNIKSTNQGPLAAVVIQAAGQINLDGSIVESRSSIQPPDPALLIESTIDGISAKSAILTSTSSGKLLKISAQGFLELDQTSVSSGGNIIIQTPGDISARSANIFNNASAVYGNGIQLTSTNGAIDLSALEVVGIPQTVINSPKGSIKIQAQDNIDAISAKIRAATLNFSIELISAAGQIDVSSSQTAGVPITDITSADNILIKAGQDIHCISSKITASGNWGKHLRFESTGVGSKLWVNNANLGGYSILAVGLQVQGVPANGNIQ